MRLLKYGAVSRALALLVLVIVMGGVFPIAASAKLLDNYWPPTGYAEDVVRGGVWSRQALLNNLWIYRPYGANENFVYYSDVIEVAGNSGSRWASRSWTAGSNFDGSFYFNSPAASLAVASDTFTTWYWGGTYVARICGNHTQWIQNPPTPRLEGLVWHDYNANGAIDAGEPALPSWSVFANLDSTRKATSSTNASGVYNIAVDAAAGMPPGTYSTGPAAVPVGWVVTKNATPVWVSEGPVNAGRTFSGMNIGVREIVPPVTTLVADPATPTGNEGWYRTPLQVTFAVNESATTRYSIDATAATSVWTSGSVSIPEGSHTILYASVDSVGDLEADKTATFKVDTIAPSAPEASWRPESLTSANIAWTNAIDNASGVAGYRLVDADTGATLATTTAGITNATIVGLDPRTTYRVAVVAVDVAGNEIIGATLSFAIDDRAPNTVLHADPATPDGALGWYVTAPQLTLSVDETATMFLGVDSSENVYLSPAVLPDGEHAVTYRAVDLAGNAEPTRTAAFKVDTTAPTSTSNATKNYTSIAAVKIISEDRTSGVARIWLSLDGAAYAATDTVSVRAFGKHVLEYYAVDVAGNAESTQTVVFSVNQPPPMPSAPPVTLVSGEALGSWTSATVTATLSATDADGDLETTWYTINDGAPVPYASPLAFETEGLSLLGYWSVDLAGNVETLQTVKVMIDKTPPSIPGAPAWSTLTTDTISLAWESSADALSGVARYELFDGDLKVADVTSPSAKVAVAAGSEHAFRVRAIDVAGNASEFSPLSSISVPTSGSTETIPVGQSVSTNLSVPVYQENRDRDQHQNGDGDALMATATVTITGVTRPGQLIVTWADSPPKAADPTFKFVNDYYDVTFTGTFRGTVTVTLPYDPRMPDARALNLQLAHFVNGKWEKAETTVDLANYTLTATVTSLSPIVPIEPAGVDTSTSLIAARPPAVIAGRPVVLTARLTDASGTPLPGFTVLLERRRDSTWTAVATATPVAGRLGSYAATNTPASSGPTMYRFRFAGEGELFSGATSAEIRVLPMAALRAAVTPGFRSAAFAVRISPPHGTTTVVVQKGVGSGYRGAGSLKLRTTRGRGVGRLPLPPGRYRFRAVHADLTHTRSTTAWRTFAIR